jgi:hypothetical protein
MVFALEPFAGVATYVGRPTILPSIPTGEAVARAPERQHGPIVDFVDMVIFVRLRLEYRITCTTGHSNAMVVTSKVTA